MTSDPHDDDEPGCEVCGECEDADDTGHCYTCHRAVRERAAASYRAPWADPESDPLGDIRAAWEGARVSDPMGHTGPMPKPYEQGGTRAGPYLVVGVLLAVFAIVVDSLGLLIVALLLLVPALIAHLLLAPPENVDRPRRPWEDR